MWEVNPWYDCSALYDLGHHQQHLLFQDDNEFQLIIFDQLQPPLLPHIQVWLSEKVFQAIVVCVDVLYISQKIMPTDFQCMNDSQ
jgi:hypothetical protein